MRDDVTTWPIGRIVLYYVALVLPVSLVLALVGILTTSVWAIFAVGVVLAGVAALWADRWLDAVTLLLPMRWAAHVRNPSTGKGRLWL